MKIDGHKLVRSDESAKRAFRHSSASFFQSLTTALVVGAAAALIGVAVGATLYYDHVAWYISAAAGPVVDTLVVICLGTIALEQARRRSIRRTLEIAFLNHHVHNALAQIVMASDVTDDAKRDRYMQEAISRISEALFRAGNESNLATLTLDVDLGGRDLTRERQDREGKWLARGA